MKRLLFVGSVALVTVTIGRAEPPPPATFSIVAVDAEAGEVGVAVASRFFAVGTVVPHARAGVGAVATQAYADTTFGPRGLDLLARGLTPEETIDLLLRADEGAERRQVGVVAADGASASFTGPGCQSWAGGRRGPGFAVQGNILAGEAVVEEMARAYLESAGQPLARRLLAALVAGEGAGGDRRGKQSAALVVARAGAGYGGHTDRAIDLRVDDHPDPLGELDRLLGLGLVWDRWNQGWTAFTEGRFEEALVWQEEAAQLAGVVPGMEAEVLYDLAVIRLAAGDPGGARLALDAAIERNPGLGEQAVGDSDLAGLPPE